MRPLGMNHFTLPELGPLAFIDLAAELGLDEVSLFGHAIEGQSHLPVVSWQDRAAIRARLDQTGLKLANVEVFFLSAASRLDAFNSSLDLAAELGARAVLVILFDDDEARTADRLTLLCQRARERALNVAVEFMAFTPCFQTLTEVAGLVARLDQPNLGIGVDILHLVRTSGDIAGLRSIDPDLLSHAQICDSLSMRRDSDYTAEATLGRVAPGDGVFPLTEFIRLLPPGLPLELEVPQQSSLDARARAKHLVANARALIAAAAH